MNKQTPYSKENEYKNNSEPSANRALPPSGEPEGASGASFISHSLSLPSKAYRQFSPYLTRAVRFPSSRAIVRSGQGGLMRFR